MATGLEISKILLNYFPPDYIGTLVEVGAAHPVNISISHLFRPLNWKIISIEPNPEFCEEFRRLNLPILEYAVCAKDKGRTSFKISPNLVSYSALEVRYHSELKEEDFKTIEVEALSLATILKNHHPEINSFDVLIVDVEGWELDVLQGIDLKKFKPKAICIECMGTGTRAKELMSYIEKQGYELDIQDEADLFYVLKIGL